MLLELLALEPRDRRTEASRPAASATFGASASATITARLPTSYAA